MCVCVCVVRRFEKEIFSNIRLFSLLLSNSALFSLSCVFDLCSVCFRACSFCVSDDEFWSVSGRFVLCVSDSVFCVFQGLCALCLQ